MSSRGPWRSGPSLPWLTGVPIIALLLLSAWCGLVAGLLEVGTIVLRKHTIDPNHLYGMSRHFVWLIPAANLCIFLVVGAVGCIVGLAWPHRGRWLFTRALCTLALCRCSWSPFPRSTALALLAVALGVAVRLVPLFERNAAVFRRFVQLSFPVVVADGGRSSRRHSGSATGSSNRARLRARCRRLGRRMCS